MATFVEQLEQAVDQALRLSGLESSPFVRAYYDDPVSFARECIDWGPTGGLTEYQDEILQALQDELRVATRGPHTLGKTTTEAIAIHWFALTRDDAGIDWKIPTTAAVDRQLTEYLWPEVHKWAKKLRWDRIGRGPYRPGELLDKNLKLEHGHAFAATSSEPEKIEGAHADELLFIFTEAKIIPAAVFDAAEGAFAGGGPDTSQKARALVQSTPGPPSGRFFEFHARRAGTEDWHVIHVTRDRAIKSGRMSADWAAKRLRQWGKTSALYLQRVLGEFATDEENAVIPLAWVEAAQERWREWDAAGRPLGPLDTLGVDVADGGADVSVIAPRHGPVITELWHQEEGDTDKLAGHVAERLRATGRGRVIIDSVGVGSGPYHALDNAGFDVVPFVAQAKVDLVDSTGEFTFAGKRSAAWWALRTLLDPGNGQKICLPPDDLLTGDLTAPTWWPTAGGAIQVESKKDIKKRIGRSTDDGDAVVQAFWIEPEIIQPGTVTMTTPVAVSPF